MELSWRIEDEDGQTRGCQDRPGPLGTVRLLAERIDATGEYSSEEWDCDRRHGVTEFEIAEGRWGMELVVTCEDGSAAGVLVPDPIVRDVRAGEVVQLNALLIVLQDGSCPSL